VKRFLDEMRCWESRIPISVKRFLGKMRCWENCIPKSVKRFLDEMRANKSQNVGSIPKTIGKSGQLF